MVLEPALAAIQHESTFPESWDEPFDDGNAFMFDPMHTPFPLTPLTQTALGQATAAGFTAAAGEFQMSMREFQIRHRNHYHYTRVVMHPPASEEDARQMAAAAEASTRTEIGRMMERWHSEHLPRITLLLQRMHALDVQGATNAELLEMLDEVDAITRELWTIHFRVGLPMLLGMQLYDELYADLFGGSDADAHALLVGGVSESVKAGFGLSDLAITARESGLEDLFRQTPVESLRSALQAQDDGRAFLDQLATFLEDYGLRQDLFELATPTWQEDPSFALAAVRGFVLSGRDARVEHAAISTAADAALDDARAQLARYPEAVRGQFEAMVQIGRQGAFLQEEHNFYIDQRGLALMRLFFVQVGDRLVSDGWLAAADDLFMLTVDELRDIIAGERSAARIDAARRLVQTRRDELAQAQALTPPPFIGTPPEGAPPTSNPMERAMIRFFGSPPQQADAPNQLKGSAGSRGVTSGIARVARSLEEAQELLPGEILVAVTTMPPWTPLFGVAAAIVTESGGPLSHCAIVAREYGIPAVVGAHGATRAIATGQRVTVDGGLGVVTIDS
jgi:phosphohistidine swiveling domain-containing protein